MSAIATWDLTLSTFSFDEVDTMLVNLHDKIQPQVETVAVQPSVEAMIKIVMHAKSGAPLEVMGLMQGKVTADRAPELKKICWEWRG